MHVWFKFIDFLIGHLVWYNSCSIIFQGSLMIWLLMESAETSAKRIGAQKSEIHFETHCCWRFELHITFPCRPNPCRVLRQGFLKAIQLCLRLREGALAHAGPPCGSFVFINRWTSGRSKGRPLGNNRRSYVQIANEILVSKWLPITGFDQDHTISLDEKTCDVVHKSMHFWKWIVY